MKPRHRKVIRRAWRPTVRSVNRSCVCVRWRAPDDLGQALTAFNRALRAHKRLARLAPSFFDTAVMDREAFNRAEQRRWMATWEPVLARVYGVEHTPPPPSDDLPPLPPLRTQQAVERHLAAWRLWMELGRQAMEHHRRRHPHALLSLCRIARLLDLAFEFKKLALGLDSPNPLLEKITYDYELTDLKRAYGDQDHRSASIGTFPGTAAPPHGPCSSGRESAPASVLPLDPKPPEPAWPLPKPKEISHPSNSCSVPMVFSPTSTPSPPLAPDLLAD